MKTIAVILTGGMSRRMGRDKGSIIFEDGETMLSRLIRRYRDAFDELYISVNERGRFDTGGAKELVDLHPGKGPMAGLEAAFTLTDADQAFLTAVDLPFGEPALAHRLAACREDADACFIRRDDGRPEPLFAIYDRRVLPAVSHCLAWDEHAFRAMFDKIKVRELREEELPEFALDHILFNVNRPTDLEQALEQRQGEPLRQGSSL